MIKTARFGWNDEGPIDRELPPEREHGLDEQVEALSPRLARRSRRRPPGGEIDRRAGDVSPPAAQAERGGKSADEEGASPPE